MKNITHWQPDTCGCTLSIITDSDSPENHEFKMVEPCKHHKHIKKDESGNEVHQENKNKNVKLLEVQLALSGYHSGEALDTAVNAEANKQCAALFGVSVDELENLEMSAMFRKFAERKVIGASSEQLVWGFDEDRKLKIKLPAKLKEKSIMIANVILE